MSANVTRTLVASALIALAVGRAEAIDCEGHILNPVTDVCWSCVLPVTFGNGTSISGGGDEPDTDAPALCLCGNGPTATAGVRLSFWEPIRTAEIVRHAFCSPTLGGIDMSAGQGDLLKAPDHGRSGDKAQGKEQRHTKFHQVHWTATPFMFLMEVLTDTHCLEQAPWDMLYLSEFDPLWDDNLTNFILAPEAALFANPITSAACAADCLTASVAAPISKLYWCSGCQGNVFPLTGWTAATVSPVDTWLLLSIRFATKLAREGVLWSANGEKGMCSPYWQPILRKDVWKTEITHPGRHASADESGVCCREVGAVGGLAQPMSNWSPGGEDGAVLLWRRRDCCAGKDVTDLLIPGVNK